MIIVIKLLRKPHDEILEFQKVANELTWNDGVVSWDGSIFRGLKIISVNEKQFVFNGESDLFIVDIVGVFYFEFFECLVRFVFLFLFFDPLLSRLFSLNFLLLLFHFFLHFALFHLGGFALIADVLFFHLILIQALNVAK